MRGKADTRQEILETTSVMLIERGDDGFTTQAVADVVNVADDSQTLVHAAEMVVDDFLVFEGCSS